MVRSLAHALGSTDTSSSSPRSSAPVEPYHDADDSIVEQPEDEDLENGITTSISRNSGTTGQTSGWRSLLGMSADSRGDTNTTGVDRNR